MEARHFAGLETLLARLGRTPADIRTVLLTHAHPDHTGLAERLRRAGAEIWIQERDAASLGDGPRSAVRHAKPERSPLPYLLRRPVALGTPPHLARGGAFTAPAVGTAHDFGAAGLPATLPGGPRAVPVPGHTPGSTAYLSRNAGSSSRATRWSRTTASPVAPGRRSSRAGSPTTAPPPSPRWNRSPVRPGHLSCPGTAPPSRRGRAPPWSGRGRRGGTECGRGGRCEGPAAIVTPW
ncbi:MBL fold metallo-hydrolase [Streptomyces sp. NPDC088261]|uniref:MBL fold metallo-hydrolase n=1 Tax=Streptomyces sp. NPDC088261 TaxID=3365851 RepID=UPI003825A4F2